jgi:hypothetical protein
VPQPGLDSGPRRLHKCQLSRPTVEEAQRGSYEDAIATLEAELGGVERAFRELSADQWRTPTLFRPLDDSKPHWTLFELAGHFDISIGLARMLMADPPAGPARPRPRELLHLLAR